MINQRTRKCAIKGCVNRFTRRSMMHKVCSIECAAVLAQSIRIEKEKKELAVRREQIKSRSTHLRECQTAFNSYIRARDSSLPCISCQRHHAGQYHAGHYLAVGSHPELRFDELNVHKQCSVCNNHLSGNQIEYRKNLILKMGVEVVEYLEGKHEAKKYSISQIVELKTTYKLKIKELTR